MIIFRIIQFLRFDSLVLNEIIPSILILDEILVLFVLELSILIIKHCFGAWIDNSIPMFMYFGFHQIGIIINSEWRHFHIESWTFIITHDFTITQWHYPSSIITSTLQLHFGFECFHLGSGDNEWIFQQYPLNILFTRWFSVTSLISVE